MKIRIADKILGEISITINTDIGKCEEYVIKSLAMLQMVCMNNKDSPEKFTQMIEIVKEAVDKTNVLYRGIDDEQSDPVSHFGD